MRFSIFNCSESYHKRPTDSEPAKTAPNCGYGSSNWLRGTVAPLNDVPGSRPANGFVTACEKYVGSACARCNCAIEGTLILRAPPAWLSLVLMAWLRLPTYSRS